MLELRPATEEDATVVAALVRRMIEEMAQHGGDAPSADAQAWSAFEHDLRREAADEKHLWLLVRAEGESTRAQRAATNRGARGACPSPGEKWLS